MLSAGPSTPTSAHDSLTGEPVGQEASLHMAFIYLFTIKASCDALNVLFRFNVNSTW